MEPHMSAFPTADYLESRFDGHIPPELLRAAYAADLARPSAAVLSSPKPLISSPRLLRAARAALMVERSAVDGACTEDHLGAAGFTRAEIAAHVEAARALAARVTADRTIARRTRV
jgi:hypothetical protein